LQLEVKSSGIGIRVWGLAFMVQTLALGPPTDATTPLHSIGGKVQEAVRDGNPRSGPPRTRRVRCGGDIEGHDPGQCRSFRVQGPRFRVQGPGSRVQGPGSRVEASGFSALYSRGFRV
jgi:hypothetical protein